MEKLVFSTVLIALFAMSSASNPNDVDMLTGVDHSYMIGLCKLLTQQGYIVEITREQCNEKNTLELIDLAINANELAKQRHPEAANDRDVNIAFLANSRRKLIQESPHLAVDSTQTNVASNNHQGLPVFGSSLPTAKLEMLKSEQSADSIKGNGHPPNVPQSVPQRVPQGAPKKEVQDSYEISSTPAWVSANDGHQVGPHIVDEISEDHLNGQWPGYPASAYDSEMNPANFLPMSHEGAAQHPQYPPHPQQQQQQYLPNHISNQQQIGAYQPAQQYPTQQHHQSTGAGFLSTLASFVSKIF